MAEVLLFIRLAPPLLYRWPYSDLTPDGMDLPRLTWRNDTMQTKRWRPWAASFLGLGMFLILGSGCADDTATTTGFNGFTGDVEEMNIDLALEDGGLSTSAESPNFGDPYFANYLTEDVERDVEGDPLADDARMTNMEQKAEVKFLRVVWGNMSHGPEADATHSDCEILDWTGKAEVTDGILMPVRTIRFERNDFIIPPWRQENPSRQEVQWVSHTGPGQDGILFKIVIPEAGDSSLGDALSGNQDGLTEDDMFIFRTGPLTLEIPLMGIEDVEELIYVDEYNGVSFVGFDRDDIDLCPRGGLEGAWVRVENDDHLGGFFRAKWMGPLGGVRGHVRGRWGVLEDGSQVFVGKIIARNGDYIGHMRGHWERSDDDPRRGVFRGKWGVHVAGRELEGPVYGVWGVSDRVEDGGFLRGRWAAPGCSDSNTGDAS